MREMLLVVVIASVILFTGCAPPDTETPAEGTAYVVCKHFGLSTKSFTYLALYEADSQQIMENLEAIAKASKEVIEFVSFIF